MSSGTWSHRSMTPKSRLRECPLRDLVLDANPCQHAHRRCLRERPNQEWSCVAPAAKARSQRDRNFGAIAHVAVESNLPDTQGGTIRSNEERDPESNPARG